MTPPATSAHRTPMLSSRFGANLMPAMEATRPPMATTRAFAVVVSRLRSRNQRQTR